MKILIKNDVPRAVFLNEVGNETSITINKSLLNLKDYEVITEEIINYCVGKRAATIRSLFTALSHFLFIQLNFYALPPCPQMPLVGRN